MCNKIIFMIHKIYLQCNKMNKNVSIKYKKVMYILKAFQKICILICGTSIVFP